jgi:transcriptional regulator with XRE-family HTH domain
MADLEIYRLIGAAIATRRKRMRLKQSEVAAEIGLTRASLANIEKGRQKVMLHHVYRLATVLQAESITDLVPKSFSFEESSGPMRLAGSDVSETQKVQIEQFVRRGGRR